MNKIHKQTDYAYCAGYIDGDGCFYIGYESPSKLNKRRARKPITSIVISSVNKDVLESFKYIFGGSVHLSKAENNNNKALYQYSSKKQDSINLIDKILPYLVEKQEESLVTKKFATTDNNQTRQECINKMKLLKTVSNLATQDHVQEFKRHKLTIIPTEYDFAYLAGFIDAECCFQISRYKHKDGPNLSYKILLQCNNTKYPVFKWLIERFGGSISFINRIKTQKAKKNQLCWRISCKALSKIINHIYPFLKHKKPVCEELMKFYTTTLPNGGARHTEKFRTHYANVLKVREEIVVNVHKLNLKGTKNS